MQEQIDSKVKIDQADSGEMSFEEIMNRQNDEL